MIGWLRTRVRKQPIIMLYFESENELKFYNLEARYMIGVGLKKLARTPVPKLPSSYPLPSISISDLWPNILYWLAILAPK